MAAETVADPNVNPWGLYVRELEFAATHTGGSIHTGGAIDAAEELLLYGLGEGWIRWLYAQLEFKDSACTPAQLEQVRKTLLKAGLEEEMIKGYLGREFQFFWRPAEHTRIAVNRAKSEATRTGPPWVVGSRTRLELVDGKLTPVENYWPIFLTDLAPVTLTVKLFQLHHDDVVTTLRRFGLLRAQKEATPQAPAQSITPEEKPEPKPELKPEPKSPEPAPTSAQEPANVTEPTESKVSAKESAANKKPPLKPMRWLEWKYGADRQCLDDPKRLYEQMKADADAEIVSKVWDWGKETFQRRVRQFRKSIREERRQRKEQRQRDKR